MHRIKCLNDINNTTRNRNSTKYTENRISNFAKWITFLTFVLYQYSKCVGVSPSHPPLRHLNVRREHINFVDLFVRCTQYYIIFYDIVFDIPELTFKFYWWDDALCISSCSFAYVVSTLTLLCLPFEHCFSKEAHTTKLSDSKQKHNIRRLDLILSKHLLMSKMTLWVLCSTKLVEICCCCYCCFVFTPPMTEYF